MNIEIAVFSGRPALTMVRPISELCGLTLLRVQRTLGKYTVDRRTDVNEAQSWEADLVTGASLVASDGESVNPNTENGAAWVGGNLLGLVNGGVSGFTEPVFLPIIRDPPTVTQIRLPDLAVVGLPLVVCADTEFADRYTVEWFPGDSARQVSGPTMVVEEVDLRTQRIPVRVTPWLGKEAGPPVSATCDSVVQIDPQYFAPAQERVDALGPRREGNSFLRIVTYNILWPLSQKKIEKTMSKSDRVAVQTRLETNKAALRPSSNLAPSPVISHESQLPVSLKSRSFRQHVLLRELLAYGPDVIALQEVTAEVWQGFLAPLLAHLGGFSVSYQFEGSGSGKAPDVTANFNELALAYRGERFTEEAHMKWRIADLLGEPVNALLKDALETCNPAMAAHVCRQPHVVQVAVLLEKATGKRLCVVNAHLIMEKFAEQLRALQACLIVRHLQRWEPFARHPRGDVGVVLCGDLNTRGSGPPDPVEALLTLLAEGEVSADHYCFVLGRDIHEKRKEVDTDEELCSVVIGSSGKRCGRRLWRSRAENGSCAGTSTLCWDHACVGCGGSRTHFKQPVCAGCKAARRVASVQETPGSALGSCPCLVEETPSEDQLLLPSEIADGLFRCRLTTDVSPLGGAPFPLANAMRELTGSCALFVAGFNPHCGTERPPGTPWIEMRDHIFHSQHFEACAAAPAPHLDSIRGLPNLSWPSDHMALCVDLAVL